MKKEKLFNLLIKFGFTQMESEKFTYFKNGKEVFVYPNGKLQLHHYTTTRRQLDMNGWMSEGDFNDKFDL